MEKNRVQVEEIRNLKIEQESQDMMLCEVTEQNKRAIEDKVMIEEDKRNISKSQMWNAHHELNVKDIEISTLKL